MASLLSGTSRSRTFSKTKTSDIEIDKTSTTDQQDSFLADDSSVFDSDLTLDLNFTENEVNTDLLRWMGAVSAAFEAVPRLDYRYRAVHRLSLLDTSPVFLPDSACEPAVLADHLEVGRVNFEVTAAEKVREGRTSYVKYTVLIAKNACIERMPSTVEKRYSDFEKLNSSLKKKFPDVMEHISFPKKLIVGNFTCETIARRSRAFEQYLTHLFSVNTVRFSTEFTEFFFMNELKLAHSMFCDRDYSRAVKLMDKCLPIQKKLQGDTHPDVVASLCSLLVCYKEIDNLSMAQHLAETILGYNVENDPHYVPLLQFAIHIFWLLGKEKQDLESRLAELQSYGIDTDAAPDLHTLIVQRFI